MAAGEEIEKDLDRGCGLDDNSVDDVFNCRDEDNSHENMGSLPNPGDLKGNRVTPILE